MNIVFFGSSQFAVPSLEALLAKGYTLCCVITQPDKKKGRGMHPQATPVNLLAKEKGLLVHQPSDVNDPEVVKLLKGLKPDLFIVIAYGQFLSQELLDIPKIIPINLHASLLPKYRGASPISQAIMNSEELTGVSIIKMDKALDAGPIIAQKQVEIGKQEDIISLEQRLADIGAKLLVDTLDSIKINKYKLTPQDKNQVTFAHKIKKEDGLINWSYSSEKIFDLIRAVAGWPGAFTYYRGKLLKIYKVKIAGVFDPLHKRKPGEIIDIYPGGIVVNTANGGLIIEELQPEGKRIMSAKDFVAGHKVTVGEMLGKN